MANITKVLPQKYKWKQFIEDLQQSGIYNLFEALGNKIKPIKYITDQQQKKRSFINRKSK